ncbi:hypothetical protein TNCV_3778521 [Trichonephila clavipes]|nr:hypothetical protein TNCV_3778521 [Trichonephila clavipes]
MWHYRVRLREFEQPIGRLRKTCKNAFPRTIPVSFGRLYTPIATEFSLNVHFFNLHVNCNSRLDQEMNGDCKAKLAAGTVGFEAGVSFFTDPNSDVDK